MKQNYTVYKALIFVIFLLLLVDISCTDNITNNTNTTNITIFDVLQLENTQRNNSLYRHDENFMKFNHKTQEILDWAIKEFIYLNNRLDISATEKQKINQKINELKDFMKNISHRYDLFDIKTQYQLNMIIQKVYEKIESSLLQELFQKLKQIEKTKKDLMTDEREIEKYTKNLPNPNSICRALNNCTTCTSNPDCGWCAHENICVEGTSGGPLAGKCMFYSYQKCPEQTDCSKHKKCKECIADVACGWCNNINLNNPTCMTKIEGEKGLCNRDYFYHIWDMKLNTCPKITVSNFINYIDNGLHPSNQDIEKQESYKIKPPREMDIMENNILLKQSIDKKLKEEIQLDRLFKDYDNTKKKIEDLNKLNNVLEKELQLNRTIKTESKSNFS